MTIAEAVAASTGLPLRAVEAVINLLDEGATVPFISRYRKERTGAMDEVSVRSVEAALSVARQLRQRIDFVIEALEQTGVLTPELRARLENASTLTEVEDIYAPYKPRRRTRATVAREKGLEPLAKIIMSGKASGLSAIARRFAGKEGVENTDEALAGASDIIAEWASENERLRNMTRRTLRRSAVIVSSPAKGKDTEVAASVYAGYASFSTPVHRCTSHQYLAMRRGEREGLLKIKFVLTDPDALVDALENAFIPRSANDECADFIADAVDDSFKRLILPSAESEINSEIKADADAVAIDIFASNLRQLLLAPPLVGRRVLAIDPAYRTGCKTVCIDESGKLLADTVIYPTPPRCDTDGAKKIIEKLIAQYHPEAVAIGNGTASRETKNFVSASGLFDARSVFVVSEDGASVYSASELARHEFPDKDVTVRGAVSIGRRLIDPLVELVKIDPKSIGVGQYQHDVDQTKLREALDYTVMSCVNAVGVNVNTASERLLSYISGIGPQLASNIVAYRSQNGAFKSRAELRRVPRLGDKAFELSAGFLRVKGTNPLDNTGIHPESYHIVASIARKCAVPVEALPENEAILSTLDAKTLADSGLGGEETIRDIIDELRKPGRDPRTDSGNDSFQPSVESFEQLVPGMKVPGIICNITAFGAFVELGIKEKGLIHISQLSKRRVASPGEVVSIGMRVMARVIETDAARRRISLSLKD